MLFRGNKLKRDHKFRRVCIKCCLSILKRFRALVIVILYRFNIILRAQLINDNIEYRRNDLNNRLLIIIIAITRRRNRTFVWNNHGNKTIKCYCDIIVSYNIAYLHWIRFITDGTDCWSCTSRWTVMENGRFSREEIL